MAVSCRGLKKHFGDVRAVDGLDLEIRPGECFGMLGPNGAGKTTTIEILEGLTTPDDGDVEILGRRWGRHDRELRERLGISLQESRITEKLTVYETLELFRSFYVRGRSPERLMADLSLEEKRDARVGKLSGASRSRARSSATRSCCSSTSRRPGSIHRAGSSSGSASRRTRPRGARCSSRRTTWRRRSGSATASRWSTTAGSSRSAHRPS
jgi:ABC-type lipoprotein export system ATPase subunit